GLSGSRIGFRGAEDLGNGLKAVFTLEYSIANDVNAGIGNTGGLNARQQFVGLEGGFGFVGLGRQYSPGFAVFKWDAAMGASPFSPQSILSVNNGMTITPNSPGRFNNAIRYQSPKMGGLSGEVIYSLAETNELKDRRTGDRTGLGLDYASGPLAVGAIYHHIEGGAASDQKEWLLGASYNFGVAKVLGSYQQNKVGGDRDKLWNIGVDAPVSEAGKVFAAYAKFDDDRGSDFDVQSWSVGYTHSLSKRTMAYAAFSQVRNDDLRAVQVNTTAGGLGDNNNNYVLGIRHVF
ncbi:MAG TPA: porin, partial [Rhodocyclaceae bacterium]|nr:porin [Rhodocyclaceae bacterium]